MQRLISKLVFIYLVLISQNAWGAKISWEALPVKLLPPQGHELGVVYSVPCGASFQGLILRKDGPVLHVGALIKKTPLTCTAMNEHKTMHVSYIDPNDFESIKSIPKPHPNAKIKIVNTYEAEAIPTKDGWDIEYIHHSYCGVPLGAFIHKRSESHFLIGTVEIFSKKRAKKCKATQNLSKISHMKFAEKPSISPFQGKQTNLTRDYFLRLAPIKRKSIRKDKKGLLQLSYRLRCNEAPIGLVTRKSKKNHLRVGMLVARYYNQPCSNKLYKNRWMKSRNRNLAFPHKKQRITAMKASHNIWDFSIKTPQRAKAVKNRALSLSYYRSCQKTVGPVFLESQSSTMNVGILEKSSQKSCKKRFKEVSLKLDRVIRYKRSRVRPLVVAKIN